MKNKPLLSSFTYVILFLTIGLLSGCQGVEGLFSDTSSPRSSESGSGYRSSQHSTVIYQSGSSSSGSSASAVKTTGGSSSSSATSTSPEATTTKSVSKTSTPAPLAPPTVGQ